LNIGHYRNVVAFMVYNTIHTDVLILGAGLAGMRAAWATLETRPDMNVTVVSQRFGPSGSSFANINNRLGMQVCLTDQEREAFIREATAIAMPGYIDPDLVRILAEESEARFHDLETIGFPFDRDDRRRYFRTAGCFSPEEKRAFIFTGLATAFEKLKEKFISLGGKFLEGWLIQDLIKEGDGDSAGVCGAILRNERGDKIVAVNAKAVIVALGGSASLFIRNVAGPGTHGISHALLKRAGANIVNAPYLQFMWHTSPSCQFWPIHSFLRKGAFIRNRHGEVLIVPEELFPLAVERGTHCPVGYEIKDAAVDHFLIENINPMSNIDVFDPQRGWFTVALMAHAGNGGAKIDKNAWTGIPGLFACGESAGGMHGANRIGGAMVAGTQVFGARAGKAAAKYAADGVPMDQKTFSYMVEYLMQAQSIDDIERKEIIPWLRQGMQKFAVLGGRPGLKDFTAKVQQRLVSTRDWRARFALESVLIIARDSQTRARSK
jgi:L-aspartate oxidase